MRNLLPDIRPGEGRGLAAAFFTLFLVLAAHTLLETARDALFLAHIPATQLPWLYIGIAFSALAITRSRRSIQGRLRSRRALSGLLVGSAVTAMIFWLIPGQRFVSTYYALYLWSGVFATLVTLQFWLVLGDIYTVTQAKRLYGFIAGGSVAGAVGGAALAYVVTITTGPQGLLVAAAGLLLLAAAGPSFLAGASAPTAKPEVPLMRGSLADEMRLVSGNRYLHRVAALVLVSSVTVTLVDWVWKSQVAAAVPAADLGRFFATTNVAFNVLALLVQLFLAGMLFRGLGAAGTLAVFPVLLVGASLGVIAFGTMAAALLLKGADGSLRYGVHRTGIELLYVPLDDRTRPRAKAFIDVVMQRGGQALGSLMILGALYLGADRLHIVVGLAALGAVWVVAAHGVKRDYVDLFRSAVSQGSFATRVELPPFNLSSLETVISALSSDKDDVVMGALELLAAQDKVRLIPALLVYHPSPRVVERVLELFVQAGRRDFATLSDRLLRHESPQIRAAALRARLVGRSDLPLLRQAMTDASPVVRATAVVGLAVAGDDVETVIAEVEESPDPAARRALAAAIERQPSPVFAPTLLRLLHDLDAGVRLEAIRAMRRRPSEEFIPPLVDLLATRLRGEARRALVAHGERALTHLAQTLSDESLPHSIRRHVPRTISQFPAERAAGILLAHYQSETDGMVRFKILRGLGRMLAEHPGLVLDRRTLDRAIDGTLEAIRRLALWRRAILPSATEVSKLLATLVKDKHGHAVERLFRLLGLVHPGERFERIYLALISADRRRQAQSIELITNVLVPPRREQILAVLDDGGDTTPVPSYQQALTEILDSTSEAMVALAAYRAGELGLASLRSRVETLRARPSRFLPEVAERALSMIDQSAPERTARA